MELRPVCDDDWPAILELANAALPWDAEGNLEWLENRKQFGGRRRHYLAEVPETDQPVGYGAIEEGPDPGSFRVFVVMAPALLPTKTGTLLYDRLLADLQALEARSVWVREYAADTDILSFFKEKGFDEQHRFTPTGYREMVVLTMKLD